MRLPRLDRGASRRELGPARLVRYRTARTFVDTGLQCPSTPDDTLNMKPAAALAALVLVFCATPALAASRVAPPATVVAVLGTKAPADEYFGPLKMSVLGVRNIIDVANIRLDHGIPLDTQATLGQLAQVEVALLAWRAKYPKDDWLPCMYANLQHVYARLLDPDAKVHGDEIAWQLIAGFPDSLVAQQMRAQVVAATDASTP
jgi:hypothetical protein